VGLYPMDSALILEHPDISDNSETDNKKIVFFISLSLT